MPKPDDLWRNRSEKGKFLKFWAAKIQPAFGKDLEVVCRPAGFIREKQTNGGEPATFVDKTKEKRHIIQNICKVFAPFCKEFARNFCATISVWFNTFMLDGRFAHLGLYV